MIPGHELGQQLPGGPKRPDLRASLPQSLDIETFARVAWLGARGCDELQGDDFGTRPPAPEPASLPAAADASGRGRCGGGRR